jgi:Glycosyltransferase family 20
LFGVIENLCRFHTYDYARHFVSACTRILGLEGTPEGVEDQGRLTRVAAVYSIFFFQFYHLLFFMPYWDLQLVPNIIKKLKRTKQFKVNKRVQRAIF